MKSLARRSPIALGGLIGIAVFSVAVSAIPVAAQSNDLQLAISRLRRLVRTPSHGARSVSRKITLPYASIIRAAARAHGIDASLLAALVHVESGFDRWAISSAGARGLTQLMPATARELGVDDLFNPEQNVNGGADYLAQQLREFGSIRLALAAYNAGPQRVRRRAIPRESWLFASQVQRVAQRYRASATSGSALQRATGIGARVPPATSATARP